MADMCAPPPPARRRHRVRRSASASSEAGDGSPAPSERTRSLSRALTSPRASPAKESDCSQEDLQLGNDMFHIYSWSGVDVDSDPLCKAGSHPLILLCFHGAGDTGLTWASLAAELFADGGLGNATLIAVDLRGHGASVSGCSDDEANLDITRLVADAMQLIEVLSSRRSDAGIILVGHSLGGSIAVRAASESLKHTQALPVRAVLLLDSVEGTAIDGLPRTAEWLKARPASFASPDEAISWAQSSGMLQSEPAARKTIPSRLRWDQHSERWAWRARVEDASSFWHGWFEGLSALFAALPLPKLLIVGGIDRLDAALEAAHMQGRFRLEVVPHWGHQLHEDRAAEVTEVFIGFLQSVQRQCLAFARLQQPSSPRHRELKRPFPGHNEIAGSCRSPSNRTETPEVSQTAKQEAISVMAAPTVAA